MIGLREPSVDNHQFSTCFNGILTLRYMYRYVTIDDMAVGTTDVKCIEYSIADLLIVA